MEPATPFRKGDRRMGAAAGAAVVVEPLPLPPPTAVADAMAESAHSEMDLGAGRGCVREVSEVSAGMKDGLVRTRAGSGLTERAPASQTNGGRMPSRVPCATSTRQGRAPLAR